MQEFCHDVAVESPSLQPLSGESISPNLAIHDDAWADIHGPDDKVHFLILGFFILMHLAIVIPSIVCHIFSQCITKRSAIVPKVEPTQMGLTPVAPAISQTNHEMIKQ